MGVAALAFAVPASADVTTTTTTTDATTTTTETVTTAPTTTETVPATTTALAPVRYGTVERGMRTPVPRPQKKQKLHQPLKVTPPLGQRGYVFPVAGASDFVDTYGALRTDVPSHWHHGDDIFAPLGTPVVAVATGRVNRVGWESVGGWRLWLRDRLGNQFYYAHLSGYAPTILRSDHVRAGEVVGFIGNTGDAITTSPHLHFEIHPRPLLHLHYDGAVDPTRYLQSWTHMRAAHPPRPVHPRLPAGANGMEARHVFRELLAARHLLPHRKAKRHLAVHPQVHVAAVVAAVPAPVPHRRVAPLAIALLMGLGSLAIYGLGVAFRSFRTYRVLASVASAIAREGATPDTERMLTFAGGDPQPDATPTPMAIDSTKDEAGRAVYTRPL
ncbi:MAG TPA: M23 family metallopeptidase [Gaiellaceae bacterium]|nr:M23 family metallopeptidase [Gaiellaceae bacterium]